MRYWVSAPQLGSGFRMAEKSSKFFLANHLNMSELADRSAASAANMEAYREATTGGFSFDNVIRNSMLSKALGSDADGPGCHYH